MLWDFVPMTYRHCWSDKRKRKKEDSILADWKHEQSPIVTILTATADNTTMQHDDTHFSTRLGCFCICGPPVLHLPTKHDSTNADIEPVQVRAENSVI